MGRGLKLGGQLRIHRNHDFSLLCAFSIPNLDLVSNPILEWLANDGSTDIHNPLLQNLRQVFFVRKVLSHFWLAIDERKDLLEAQILVHRNVQ